MLQRDYFLRMIQEFAGAWANFLEKQHDDEKRDREMAELYRQYVGDYGLLRNLSVAETMTYAHDTWPDDERIERLGILAELLYTEASYKQAPLCLMLYEKAYSLYDYVDRHSDTFSMSRRQKMKAISTLLADATRP